MKKLLLIAPDSVHTFNFLKQIDGYFSSIQLISGGKHFQYPESTVILNFGLRNPFSVLKTIRAIKKQISIFNPNVIHIHQANSYGWMALQAAKSFSIPTILTAWGSDVLVNSKRGFPLANLLQYNLNHANFFTSDSKFMAAEMQRLANKKLDISICNFGFDPMAIEYNKEDLIYSNRSHTPLYRIENIINAFANLPQPFNNFKLVIAGNGVLTEKLKLLVEQLHLKNKIEFVGFVSAKENAMWYQRSKYFISIPQSDATSISLLEAMYYGCIPVLSNLPANLEWVTNGVNGFVIEDVSKDFLNHIFNCNLQEIANHNLKLIEQKGTREAGRKIFLELYNKVLHEN